MITPDLRPLVLITGAGGNLGQTLARALGDHYRLVGLDRQASTSPFRILQADFSSAASIDLALHQLRALQAFEVELGEGRIVSSDERDFHAYRWKNQHPFCNLLLVQD